LQRIRLPKKCESFADDSPLVAPWQRLVRALSVLPAAPVAAPVAVPVAVPVAAFVTAP